ncbi:hypothetical protein FRC12_010895 [Ceratobasidium sp. 428]|nr:hypothetical protein FRC12_010895 [Ceratobasidium sp. 428]
MATTSAAPPRYSLTEDRKTKPFAEVANRLWDNPVFREVLASFRRFLSKQEIAKITKNQLGLLRALSVLVLEASAESINDGEDVSDVLATSTQILNTVSSRLEAAKDLNDVIQNLNQLDDMESNIRESFAGLETQLRKLVQATKLETTIYTDELSKAQRSDRAKTEEVEAIVRQMAPQSGGSFDTIVGKSMEEKLKAYPTVGQAQMDAKRALAILTELTGRSLPSSTMLGKDFVTIGHEIHQGTNYDVFMGEYFTGEKIAVKQLRHRVDEETAKKTHERFARQALNWSSLRHDAILPFYGIGVAPSPVIPGDFQLYMVSPYLQNRDARRYLMAYPSAPQKVRVQMVLDVARGLYHMHEAAELPEPGNGIVHSALNIFNVLIKDSGRAVISGFGHSKVIRDFQESFTGDNAEYRYMAPEMMTDEPHITHGIDIWSWAMTALEILTDVPAFGEKTKGPKIIALLTLGRRPNRADHPKLEEYPCADDLWNLFEGCWDQDAAARPTADKVAQRLKPMLQRCGRRPKLSHQMSTTDMVRCIVKYGCPNMTDKLDLKRCSDHSVDRGGSGEIYKGYLLDGAVVAIKCPWPSNFGEDGGSCLDSKSAIMELYKASKLDHPNIIKVKGVAHFKDKVAMISPWMGHGTVMAYLKKHPSADRLSFVSSALVYMHKEGIVHGDLKGANVMISEEGIVKVIDFGSTSLKAYTLRFTSSMNSPGYSLRWASPEVLESGTSTPESDVFALGMTILEIITGDKPFSEMANDVVVMRAITNQKLPIRPKDLIPLESRDGDKLWHLLNACWAFNPDKRPQAAELETTLRTITQEGLKKGSSLGTNSIGPPSDTLNLTDAPAVGDREPDPSQQSQAISEPAASGVALGQALDNFRQEFSPMNPVLNASQQERIRQILLEGTPQPQSDH